MEIDWFWSCKILLVLILQVQNSKFMQSSDRKPWPIFIGVITFKSLFVDQAIQIINNEINKDSVYGWVSINGSKSRVLRTLMYFLDTLHHKIIIEPKFFEE